MIKWWIIVLILGFQAPDGLSQDFDAGHSPGLAPAQIADGWLSLFDGRTKFGWRDTQESWHIGDGCLRAKPGQIGMLRSAVQFDSYELRLEYRASESAEGEILIRTSPKSIKSGLDCYAINIAPPSSVFPTGSVINIQNAKSVKVAGGENWSKLRILVDGPVVNVWLNDARSLECKLPSEYLGKGYLGLRCDSGEMAFRHIHLRPLKLDPIFDGSDLDAWDTGQALDSRFSIDEEKNLRMLGGWGQLESKSKFGDFIFSSHVRTNAPGLNSGIFFRCIPGQVMNGYESQIQNEYKDSDLTQPKDCGTGGIFRRQNARFVNARDQAWFAKTIVTSGATMCVWVNGCMVSDWTDNRAANANPRKGQRLEAGTFCLQGHDPTTDVSFRKIGVRELDRRRARQQ